MEIGNHGVHDLEVIAGENEQAGWAGIGRDGISLYICRAFQRTHGGRADCDHPATCLPGFIDGVGGMMGGYGPWNGAGGHPMWNGNAAPNGQFGRGMMGRR